MFYKSTSHGLFATVALVGTVTMGAGIMGAGASAATLEITVTNTSGIGGFAITPLLAVFHDGSYDAFNVGDAASPGLESLAETGNPSGLPAEIAAADPSAASVVIAAPDSGPPTIDPGETTSAMITLDETSNRYLSFLAMLVPSNDTFLGNDDATAYEIFDAMGDFVGDFSIEVSGLFLYDAGTEVNDPTDGAAFVAGVDATLGTDEGGTVHAATSLAAFAGVATPLGTLDGSLIDFTTTPSRFSLATISISAVPPAPVPLPASALLLIGSIGLLGGVSRRKRRLAG